MNSRSTTIHSKKIGLAAIPPPTGNMTDVHTVCTSVAEGLNMNSPKLARRLCGDPIQIECQSQFLTNPALGDFFNCRLSGSDSISDHIVSKRTKSREIRHLWQIFDKTTPPVHRNTGGIIGATIPKTAVDYSPSAGNFLTPGICNNHNTAITGHDNRTRSREIRTKTNRAISSLTDSPGDGSISMELQISHKAVIRPRQPGGIFMPENYFFSFGGRR